MKIRVDEQADAMYLRLDDSSIVDSKEVAPGVVLDYNAQDRSAGPAYPDFLSGFFAPPPAAARSWSFLKAEHCRREVLEAWGGRLKSLSFLTTECAVQPHGGLISQYKSLTIVGPVNGRPF